MLVPALPDPPFASGAPYWYWLGGRAALDLVNTRRERWNRDVECLVDGADLIRWLVAARLLPAPVRAPAGLVEEARVLREAIDAGARAAVARAPADAAAVSTIDAWLEEAGARPRLAVAPDGRPVLAERPPRDAPRRALAAVALDAARMLGDPGQAARVRVCGSRTCSARFYDRSPAGRRRWCSMEACGNVEKARRRRARERIPAVEQGATDVQRP